MAKHPYTDEAVQLVADIVASLYGVVTVESIGKTILRELAAAGRLLPEGEAEITDEWGVLVRHPDGATFHGPADTTEDMTSEEWAREKLAELGQGELRHRRITHHVTDWRPAPINEEGAG